MFRNRQPRTDTPLKHPAFQIPLPFLRARVPSRGSHHTLHLLPCCSSNQDRAYRRRRKASLINLKEAIPRPMIYLLTSPGPRDAQICSKSPKARVVMECPCMHHQHHHPGAAACTQVNLPLYPKLGFSHSLPMILQQVYFHRSLVSQCTHQAHHLVLQV